VKEQGCETKSNITGQRVARRLHILISWQQQRVAILGKLAEGLGKTTGVANREQTRPLPACGLGDSQQPPT
jgi:hypothetical protein